jgi:hypothetical protein
VNPQTNQQIRSTLPIHEEAMRLKGVKWSKMIKMRKNYIILTSPIGGAYKKGEALQNL